ncbi:MULTISPECIES: hypothetical protein [unclassified Herbaspirillum]|uniref:hypothetical protein n=1 Tax=unclassified Herbaspirillum TaxID=2624150 RepID=UPI0011544EC2|nr:MULTISPECIES: hypothetical protein [unclassified Herbaspirillum]MBB5393923.1 hypothetical protein [Herbaspirillum sp. SJZ102]TQK00039.1 hypothetical protein FB599_4001 [Herbaspirillum sp. SJZ130]TQK04637.1 hypothetical protein FB598_3959 [Herbaspirillum sp. SJZ106]
MGKKKSDKTVVIEYIFDQLYDSETEQFTRTIVTSEDLQNAKRYCAEHHQITLKLDGNPFNFMKDIVRGKSANKIWPERLRKLGIVGQQRTGNGAIFEFVRQEDGSPESFEEDFRPTETTPRIPIQSLSLPLASKSLGRTDESWLLQVAVNLRVVETHFATGQDTQVNALELSHLQMDIKLRKVQIDALFLAQFASQSGEKTESALITVEAKQGNQRILTEQIARQVRAAFDSTKTNLVIPLAIAAIKNQGIYVVEFKAVNRSEIDQFMTPIFHRDAMFILYPAVTGI